MAGLAVLVATATLAGCGTRTDEVGTPAATTYEGPLYVDRADATHPRAGAAGDVVDCRTWGRGGSAGDGEYREGATADSPAEALDVARSEWLFGGTHDGLTVAKQEEDRVLYVVEVEGVVKQAVIVRDGPASEGAGGPGWYVESWAHCDFSELPRSFTDSIGLQVWTDRDGRPAPTTEIEARTGPEHCDWQSMTFLTVGAKQYVREPLRDLAHYFAGPYEAHATLPADAVPTEFRRDGERLWLSADRQQAFVGTPDDVEVWPRLVDPLGCD